MDKREVEVERGVFSASPTRGDWVKALAWEIRADGYAYVQQNEGVSPLWCAPGRWREVVKK
jgi:hypothetical protein